MLRQTPDPHWFMKQIDYKVARMGVMTQHKLLINVVKLAGEKICLLSILLSLVEILSEQPAKVAYEQLCLNGSLGQIAGVAPCPQYAIKDF